MVQIYLKSNIVHTYIATFYCPLLPFVFEWVNSSDTFPLYDTPYTALVFSSVFIFTSIFSLTFPINLRSVTSLFVYLNKLSVCILNYENNVVLMRLSTRLRSDRLESVILTSKILHSAVVCWLQWWQDHVWRERLKKICASSKCSKELNSVT